jgi:hypothetical protein
MMRDDVMIDDEHPTSQVPAPIMLVLPTVGNEIYEPEVASNSIMSTPNFMKIHSAMPALLYTY